MSRQIVIGKDGEQKFPIINAGVSRQHARITITGNEWILEDLNSTNGTYIRDKDGNFERVLTKRINEDTVIRLGDSSINGYTFWAHHVLAENPNDYAYEFAKIYQLREQLIAEKKAAMVKSQQKAKILRIGITLIPALLSLFLTDIIHIRAVMIIPTIFMAFIPQRMGTEQIDNKIKNTLVCPKCGRPLSEYEIKSQQCMSCKSHS